MPDAKRPVWMDAYEATQDIAMDLAHQGGELEELAKQRELTPVEQQEEYLIGVKLRFLNEVEQKVCAALRK